MTYLLNNIPAEHLHTQCLLKYLQERETYLHNEPFQTSDVTFSFPETFAFGPCSPLEDMMNEVIPLSTKKH